MTMLATYADLLTQASYLHVAQEMPNTLAFLQAMPFKPVTNTVGTIIKADLDGQRRNDGVASAFGDRISARLASSSTVSYQLEPYTDAETALVVDAVNAAHYQAGSPDGFLLETAGATAERTLIKVIKGFADEFLAEGNYGTAQKTDPTNWTTSTTDLVAQVRAKVLDVHKQSGLRPDTIILTPDVHYVIENNVSVQDALAGFGASTSNGTEYQGQLGLDVYARVFGVKRYFVLDAAYNGAGVGATASNAWVETNKMLICNMGGATTQGNVARQRAGLGVGLYMDYSGMIGSDGPNIIGNKLGSLPFPLWTRQEYEGCVAGGGSNIIISEAAVDFKLIEPKYGHLFYGAIA